MSTALPAYEPVRGGGLHPDDLDEPFSPPHTAGPGGGPLFVPPRFPGLGGDEAIRQSYASSQVSLAGAQSYATADYDSVHGLAFNAQHHAGSPSLSSLPPQGHNLGSPLLPTEPYRDDPYRAAGEAPGAIPLSPVGTGAGTGSHTTLAGSGQGFREFPEKRDYYGSPRQKTQKKLWATILVLLGIVAVVAAVGLPVYIFVVKPSQNKSSDATSDNTGSGTGNGPDVGGGGGPTTNPGKPTNNVVITGGDGSKVTTDNGTTFTYTNKFGGYWYFDPEDPFNNGARAQSWSPALNETWDWNNDRVRGVNLGGWLNTEPFISPALYEKYYPNAVDEYTLSQQMAADVAGGGLKQLEDHYATFITEEDFAMIAGAGLNWVRLPLPFWAIETWDGEPFLEGVAWTYFLKAVQWARKYGIRINLDFHAVPGSQNGWNHSGRLGRPNFLYGVMGLANADRTLDYLRILIQFISQPQYKDVVPMLGLINEAFTPDLGDYEMNSFYLKAHDLLRGITGTGAGNGPILSIHDGFTGAAPWAGKFPGSDRLALDIHPYFAFGEQSSAPMSQQALRACQTWAPGTNSSFGTFGITAAGEFSNAINDCGLYVNGVGIGTRWEGTFPGWTQPAVGNCSVWTNYKAYTDQAKADMKLFAMASMDALVHWFFWTWKIGPTLATGVVDATFWSYKLGLEEGWMPTDPREANGICAGLGVSSTPAPALPATATGGAGAGTINPAFRASYTAWPVTSLSGIPNVAMLPTYTLTGTLKTMSGPTFTTPSSTATFDAGSGWFNAQDTLGAHVPVKGCTYPDEYSGQISQVPIPTAVCTGAKKKRDAGVKAPVPGPTPAP